MNHFITNIKINKLLHLCNIDIPVTDQERPHLIITGKNGSGKTILLNAIADFLGIIRNDILFSWLSFEKKQKYLQEQMQNTALSYYDRKNVQSQLKQINQKKEKLNSKVDISFSNVVELVKKYNANGFIMTFYQASRKPEMLEPTNPTKPDLKNKNEITNHFSDQFLYFLSDLKIQEALARNEKQYADADEIKKWFDDFEILLKKIYMDEGLILEFNYRDYSFKILTEGKSFKFTQLSDGFSAILEIVTDLILKMQDGNTLSRNYKKEGIVLIDEIETHLHLELQKIILPLLTRVFPNIQFIVTTHSPFVLNSIDNAVAYDLEHRTMLTDLEEYSYESLAEGYFGVDTESNYAKIQLKKFKELLEKQEPSALDKIAIKQFADDFDKIPEAISPIIVGQYRQLANTYADIIKEARR